LNLGKEKSSIPELRMIPVLGDEIPAPKLKNYEINYKRKALDWKKGQI
jgi:hypothetical protein